MNHSQDLLCVPGVAPVAQLLGIMSLQSTLSDTSDESTPTGHVA
jgi:hypothetical protein